MSLSLGSEASWPPCSPVAVVGVRTWPFEGSVGVVDLISSCESLAAFFEYSSLVSEIGGTVTAEVCRCAASVDSVGVMVSTSGSLFGVVTGAGLLAESMDILFPGVSVPAGMIKGVDSAERLTLGVQEMRKVLFDPPKPSDTILCENVFVTRFAISKPTSGGAIIVKIVAIANAELVMYTAHFFAHNDCMLESMVVVGT